MKYVYRVEFILSFVYEQSLTRAAPNLNIDGEKKNNKIDYTTFGLKFEEAMGMRSDTHIVKKIVAEDHRDVLSKIDKLFKTWWDDPKTLREEVSVDHDLSQVNIVPKTLKLDITKLERGTQIDIE